MRADISAGWSPSVYLEFEDERTRPARDLLAQVRIVDPHVVVDVGCGPGNSTELLVPEFPDSEIIGFDTSEAMLTEARLRVPSARFEIADAANWMPAPRTELVFANAVYQWVPDHLRVLSGVLDRLEPSGTLAVQMPDNLMDNMHVLMREVAASGRWAGKLANAARAPLPPVGAYYDALAPHASRVDIWHSIYNHVLPNAAAIVEWVKGTGLNPFLARLDPAEQIEFLAAYGEAIEKAYPPAADGRVLMRFSRLFIIAER